MFAHFEEYYSSGMMASEQPVKGQDIFYSLSISFQEAFQGVVKEIEIEKMTTCHRCHGTKSEPRTESDCDLCHGTGTLQYKQGLVNLRMPCPKCQEARRTLKNPCTACDGEGLTSITHKEEVYIPKGMDSGQRLNFTGKVNTLLLIMGSKRGNIGTFWKFKGSRGSDNQFKC
mgnify:CR=1 FL=1